MDFFVWMGKFLSVSGSFIARSVMGMSYKHNHIKEKKKVRSCNVTKSNGSRKNNNAVSI